MEKYSVSNVSDITGLSGHVVRTWAVDHDVQLDGLGHFRFTRDQLYRVAADHDLEITILDEGTGSDDAEVDDQDEDQDGHHGESGDDDGAEDEGEEEEPGDDDDDESVD